MTHLVIRSATGGGHEAPLVQSSDGEVVAREL
jgi:hypothetical protein